jgi:hypothetical protein
MFGSYSLSDTIRTSQEDTEGPPTRTPVEGHSSERPKSAAGPKNLGKGRDSTELTLKMGNHPRRRFPT